MEEERRVVLQQTFKIIDYDFSGEKSGEIGDPMLVSLFFKNLDERRISTI